ncbi:uncharacterized protein LOC122852436 isoform X2 [Aphidius gifuensis]|uniref:uncharacterized protein LOC122852436 isoform X2 n=1 Tax=Aphidius gifuensis TaxID=684658 RepID=UPI001CDBFEC0|nr:uncharacterized protein LOC122852436 isoform X2 [Aphidius gifuensis]
MSAIYRILWIGMVIMLHVVGEVFSYVQSEVKCTKDSMEIIIEKPSPEAKVYLRDLKHYPDEACKPQIFKKKATFKLSLAEEEMSRCGIARLVNKISGEKVYYHQVIVEESEKSSKHHITVKCDMMIFGGNSQSTNMKSNHTAARRSVLPAGFQEDDTIDIGGVISGVAPLPMLSVGVRQGGKLVTGELNVSPGTPLQMEIFLDNKSSPVYGLLVTYMQVTDTKSAEETIIFNGCSVDPYLFENFNTVDGDFLVAKFRAFKFPESTYVQFRGTVNVCLDKCQGVDCSNGQIGFGRKKRSISMSENRNNVFEVTMSTFIKVDWDKNTVHDDVFMF